MSVSVAYFLKEPRTRMRKKAEKQMGIPRDQSVHS